MTIKFAKFHDNNFLLAKFSRAKTDDNFITGHIT